MSDAERTTALERFHLLQPALEAGVPLTQLAAAEGLALRTLERWCSRYRREGLAGLVRQPRSDRGQRHLPAELVQLIEGLALGRPRPSIAAIHRQSAAAATQAGWPTPSYSTVYDIVRALDPALVSLAHDGAKTYHERFDLLYRRTASGPNAIWQADHTQLNCWVRDAHDQPVKPWLTVILDDYSRAVAGFRVSLSAPSALQTALALRDAIWRKAESAWHVCGIPDVFYTDHGSDFTSQHLEQVGLDLRMQLVFSTAGVPRGRGKIERFFQTVSQLFLCTQPGYTPPGQRAPVAAGPLTLTELDARLRDFIVAEYHQRIHSETNQAPQAHWDAGGLLPRLPESLAQLDLLLLTVAKARTVHRDGIHFQGLRYLDPLLAAYVGEAVTIRYDPRDLVEIRVFYEQQFLCRAICQELAGTTISLREIVQARRQRRRELQAGLHQRRSVVDAVLATAVTQRVVQDVAPSPVVSATADAGLPRPALKRYRDD
ncbi:MAG: Mu transposase C-terminal domain-containing protein [Chloroflexota bacterium]|nr:Mu transposase C-terminal domain-containing protein [Chloroflexota bacterium]